jgi:hypothetical protein
MTAVQFCIWWTIFAGAVNIIGGVARKPDRWSVVYALVGVGLITVGARAL